MNGDVRLHIRRLAIDAGCVDGPLGDFEAQLRDALRRRWSGADGAAPAQTLAERVGGAIVPHLQAALPVGVGSGATP